MNILKKFIIGIASAALMLGATMAPAFADVGDATIWNLTGAYTIDFTCVTGCSGDFIHTMKVTSMDDNTGNFSGTGYYNVDNSYTWNVAGNVNGNLNTLSFDITYTGSNPGYTLHGNGQVNFDGTLSGTASNNTQSFTFQSTSGKAKHEKIHVSQEVSRKQCDAKGKAIIDVSEKVKNDADSGFVSPTSWANDNYTRHIKVWKTDDNTFCADVSYDGSFDARSGHLGPAGVGTIGSNVHGDMDGGYRSTEFTGTLKSTPLWPTHGSVGTVDYQCDINYICPGIISWPGQYFDSTPGFNLAWWGWTYKAGKHGTWINASNGNSGNIL